MHNNFFIRVSDNDTKKLKVEFRPTLIFNFTISWSGGFQNMLYTCGSESLAIEGVTWTRM